MLMKRWLWIIALIAFIAVGIFFGLRPQPVPVELGAASFGPLRVTIEEEGKTRLRDRFTVYAPLAGLLDRLPWREGDLISAGKSISRLRSAQPVFLDARSLDQAQARVTAAEAAVRLAESRLPPQLEQVRAASAELDFFRSQALRDRRLSASGDIPAARLERSNADLNRAEAGLAAAEKTLASLRSALEAARAEVLTARAALRPTAASSASETIPIPAPASGRVIRVLRQSAGMVMPGEPLLEIGDARGIEIVVELLSADAVRLPPGARILIDRWGGNQILEARLHHIEPGGFTKISALGVEEQRVRVIATLVSPPEQWAALGDAYRVEASFILWESPRVLQVPANALFRSGEQWCVFLASNDIARKRIVEIGHRSPLAVEILSGLNPGDPVILHPDETVAEGKTLTTNASP